MNSVTMNHSTLMQASRQWMSRPDDERFTSLTAMAEHCSSIRSASQSMIIGSRRLTAIPVDTQGLTIEVDSQYGETEQYYPTNWAFGQVAQLAEAPASYLRTIPAPIAADCINYGLRFKRDIADVGVLTYSNGTSQLRAATGPGYGRIWNADVVSALMERFGDGVSGDAFRVPGIFGKPLDQVTKRDTTLFASDRDMFVFLADENHRIEIPNRRNGESGSLARGFFVWNSEVGNKTFGFATFLFDYVCCNRIVWGASEYKQITIRHTASAPDKFLAEIQPALESYASSSEKPVVDAIEAARAKKIDDVESFLANRFGKRVVTSIQKVHELEEGRPIETLWDASTAVTAYARSIEHQDRRVDVEREAGKILALAS